MRKIFYISLNLVMINFLSNPLGKVEGKAQRTVSFFFEMMETFVERIFGVKIFIFCAETILSKVIATLKILGQ